MNQQPLVTIIIPCYNHGNYIQETLDSLEKVIDRDKHEVIIINDGSTDELTLNKFKELEATGKYKIVHQENKGLSATRNVGLSIAQGKYIVPLDSDNLLMEGYLTKGVEVLNSNEDVTVVYGKSKRFGEGDGFIPKYPLCLQTLFMYNDIDACALYRKDAIVAAGGYDENMKTGFEDWELWIRLVSSGHKFHYLENEVVQHYRVLGNSMARSLDKLKTDKIIDYMQKKHPTVLSYDALDEYYFSKFTTAPFGWTFKLFVRKYFPNWYKKLVAKGRFRKHL